MQPPNSKPYSNRKMLQLIKRRKNNEILTFENAFGGQKQKAVQLASNQPVYPQRWLNSKFSFLWYNILYLGGCENKEFNHLE